MDDGSQLTDSAIIQTICREQKRNETRTARDGSFSFQIGGLMSSTTQPMGEADASTSGSMSSRPTVREWRDCEVLADLPGFTSSGIQLGGTVSEFEGNANIGRIVLHRMGNVSGFTISATSAAAPKPAKQALEKGQEQEKKNRWDDAQKSFEKAVGLYPKFAAAWVELGRIQLRSNDLESARHSFQQAIQADSGFLSPYLGLTQLALRERNWRELSDFSGKALALNPVNFPDVWFYNAVGQYNLGNLEAAEKSARRGLQVDSEHHVPKLDYLLGLILLKKPDLPEAAEHLRTFMRGANKADAADAQQRLDEITRLSAVVSPPADEKE